MLIVWKWEFFASKNREVTDSLLSQLDFANNNGDIEKYQDDLFDEFIVCDQKPDGTSPPVIPTASIVRTNIKHDPGKMNAITFQYLQVLIKFLKDREETKARLFVFLHRTDGFGEKEVEHLLESKICDRCFLIGDGRDVIYYQEEFYRGLLGQNARFQRTPSKAGKSSVKVAEEKEKIVYNRYFSKVWNHYEHEFYSKIYELKVDLMTCFYSLHPNEKKENRESFRKHLEEYSRPELQLRLISFIDDKDVFLSKSNEEKLRNFERSESRSFIFDDLKANLQQFTEVQGEYTKASDLLFWAFFKEVDEELDQVTISINELLQQIEDVFSSLLLAIDPNQKKLL